MTKYFFALSWGIGWSLIGAASGCELLCIIIGGIGAAWILDCLSEAELRADAYKRLAKYTRTDTDSAVVALDDSATVFPMAFPAPPAPVPTMKQAATVRNNYRDTFEPRRQDIVRLQQFLSR